MLIGKQHAPAGSCDLIAQAIAHTTLVVLPVLRLLASSHMQGLVRDIGVEEELMSSPGQRHEKEELRTWLGPMTEARIISSTATSTCTPQQI